MKKVKLAEEMSDLDSSDVEKQKRNRRNRAKKIVDSSDNEELSSTLPCPPKIKILSTLSSQPSTSSTHSYQKKLSTKVVSKQKCNETTLMSKENRNHVEEVSFSPSFKNKKVSPAVHKKESVREQNSTMAVDAGM